MPTYKNKNIILGLKIKTLATTNQTIWVIPPAVQHITQLARILFCGEMIQPYTIQIIWCIPVAVDISIYSRSISYHTVGTSHIYLNI
jgi:hypothetical protein